MKRSIAALIIILVFSIFAACGSDDPPYIPPVDPPTESPVIMNTVDFSCVSVDNDQTCSGILEGGVWNSGPVVTTDQPMPEDYLNLEITNNMVINATVFAVANIVISGCWEDIVAFDAVELLPNESATFTALLWNYRCGMLGYQDSIVSIYNADSFDPTGINPINYPRTDLITNAVVIWDNRMIGSMP